MEYKFFSNLHISLSGRLFYRLIPIRKHIVLDNIDRVFKDAASDKEKENLAKAFYSHLASVLKELILISWVNASRIDALVEIRGIEYLLEAKSQGRGGFILSGHLGNWELCALFGLPRLKPLVGNFNVIRRPLHFKWLEKKLFQRLEQRGIALINKFGALLKINQAIKAKEFVVFLIDQHAEIKNKEGIAVDFFGTKAGTYRSLAYLANKSKSPVIPLSLYRDKNGKHIMEFHPSLSWIDAEDKEQAIYLNTLLYNQVLEQMILKHPEQWWWLHRRWKL